MAKIKENQRLKKIGYVQTPELNHIVFSFEFWTTNAKYNFEYFKKSLRDKEKAYDELHSKLHELCQYWRLRRDRKSGEPNIYHILGFRPVFCQS